jgi:hypothetical protein
LDLVPDSGLPILDIKESGMEEVLEDFKLAAIRLEAAASMYAY